jgi:thiamine biosynthesis lipoprotein
MLLTEEQHEFELFGTRVRVLIGSAVGSRFRPIGAAEIEERLRMLHHALTRFDPHSELSRLNDNAGHAVPVSAPLLRAVAAAVRAAELSDGLIDPTILPALERAGYAGSRAGSVPVSLAGALAAAPPRRPATAKVPAHWRSIDIDVARRTVRLPAGTRVDLGGTAKGLAVDLAADMLSLAPAFAVDAGGDIRIGGTAALPRGIEIEHPLTGLPARRSTLVSGAVATSGLRTRIWRTEAGYAHHLIDPARGTPAWTGVIQATAFAPSAVEAETRAKSALLRGPLGARSVLGRYGGAVILDDGEVIVVGDPARLVSDSQGRTAGA